MASTTASATSPGGSPVASRARKACSIARIWAGFPPSASLRRAVGRFRSDSPMRVFTTAGQSTDTFTLEPVSASSWCKDSDRATTACLLAQYIASQGRVCSPAPDAVFTTWHSSPCSSITGTKARIPWITPQRFTPSTHSQSFSVFCHVTPPTPTPALLHRTWTAPIVSTVNLASASTSSDLETSVRFAVTAAPAAFSSRSVRFSASSSRSASTTFMPSAANRPAIARPMPLAAPVTTATFPFSSFTSTSSLLPHAHHRRHQAGRLPVRHRQRLPRERPVPNQLQYRLGDFCGSEHRHPGEDGFPALALLRRHRLQPTPGQLCVYEAGANAIHPDARLVLQEGERPCQAHHAVLGSGIDGFHLVGNEPRKGCAVDDHPSAAEAHGRYHCLDRADDRRQVDRYRLPPSLAGHLREARPARVDAGVVVEDVQPPERLHAESDHPLQVLPPRNIGVYRRRPSPGLLDEPHRLLSARFVDVGDDDRGPLQHRPQVCRAVHVVAVAAHRLGHMVIPHRRVVTAEPGRFPSPDTPLGALLHPPRPVHSHDDGDGQLVADRRLQFLHVEPECAVPTDG